MTSSGFRIAINFPAPHLSAREGRKEGAHFIFDVERGHERRGKLRLDIMAEALAHAAYCFAKSGRAFTPFFSQ